MEVTLCGRCGCHSHSCPCNAIRRETWEAAAAYAAGDAKAASRLSMIDAAYVLDNLACVFRAFGRKPETPA